MILLSKQLATGGGQLFKWISRDEKAFLNVDSSKFQKGRLDPDAFVVDQASQWKGFWAPIEIDPNNVALLLNKSVK